MPGIKKKWIKASHNDQTARDVPDDGEDIGDEDRELGDGGANRDDALDAPVPKPRKRPAQGQGGMLKGLDGEVLLEKRKRFIPPAELKLTEWLDNNLEQRTEETLSLTQLYTYYTEICKGDASDILDVPAFNRMIKVKFGKAFGLKENSVYKGLIKERKLNQEKKKVAGIRMKDAVHEAINFYGNPWHGVRFFTLKQYIGSKYPAFQIDIKPKVLKRALEMGLQYGKIDLVKGIGMAGFYKLPGGEEPPPKPKKAKKEEAAPSTDDGEAEQQKEGEEKDEKSQDGKDESVENGDKKEEEGAAKKKPQKPRKPQAVSYSQLSHGSPQKIEDTFPLAITYQSAPKTASIPRIRKYITEKYGDAVSDHRWRQAIDRGVDKGYWEHISGSGISGRLHLLMDDFDPSSDQIEDQICAAIIACHEPKAASANQIKKYVSSYHPEFQVDVRPDKFKKALIRAVAKSMIVQVSGLGANGSFQLTAPFIPSPSVLAGEDDSEDEEEDNEDGEVPVYVPRGTKSRGMPKVKTMEIITSPSRLKAASGRGRPAGAKGRARKSRVKSYEESEDEEEEEVVVSRKNKRKNKSAASSGGRGGRGRATGSKKRAPSPLTDEEEEVEVKAKKPGKKPAAKSKKSPGRKRAPSPLTDEEEEEEEEEEEPEYTPVKSKSRGRQAKPAAAEKATPKSIKTKIMKEGQSISTLKVNITALENLSSSKESPKKSRGAKAEASTPSSGRSSKKSSAVKRKRGDDSDADDESDEAPEYTPRKSKSRGGDSTDGPASASGKADKKRRGR
ncbi:heterochromatin protein 1-binding protein 3 [Aplysia californica]|uniref:Heterochromatin protein 1-binding protein 3 n=1 Tax=Aplysia californica TaxID=6500 RepID=A0ABM0K1Z8_APLCA|nr:heterochromatin protein 1-binding protein 3 [Aplysia californica]